MMLDILKARWGQLVRPPFVRQVVVEWPENWGKVPAEVISTHPVLKAGLVLSSKWWLPGFGLPQIHDGWTFAIETIVDPWDSLGAETCWQIANDLIKKSDRALSELLGETSLTAEIVRRLAPRQLVKRRRPVIGVNDLGEQHRFQMLERWLPANLVVASRSHYRSWVIDDLAADSELLFRQFANGESVSPVGLVEPLTPITKEAASILRFLASRHPELSSLDDIETGTVPNVCRDKAQAASRELIDAGYAHRPCGPKKGLAASETGLSVANKLSTK